MNPSELPGASRMRRALLILSVTALLLLCLAASHADALINPGFETATISGWTMVQNGGGVTVAPTWLGSSATYSPAEGKYFLAITAGDADTLVQVYQDVALSAGQRLEGWAAFDSNDSIGGEGDGGGDLYNDWAEVDVFDGQTQVAQPWYADVLGTGNFVSGPWTYWSWTAPADGTYRLVYGCANYDDNESSSNALFDAGRPAVPEPGTMALLLMGLPMAGLLRRRK